MRVVEVVSRGVIVLNGNGCDEAVARLAGNDSFAADLRGKAEHLRRRTGRALWDRALVFSRCCLESRSHLLTSVELMDILMVKL